MSEEQEFKVKQTVWATVQGFPAWPAKIVKRLNIHGKTVFKVNFYGDPTYCYLHQHSLRSFQDFHLVDLKELEQNLKLKRAIELAQLSVYKNYQLQNIPTKEQSAKTQQSPIQTLFFELSANHSQNSIDLPQKKMQHQNILPFFNDPENLNINEISSSNVLEILDCYHNGKMTQRIANLKRKQIITFQNQLKQNLLFKYNLLFIDHIKQTPKNKNQQIFLTPIEKLRAAKKQKKSLQVPKFEEKEQSIRKIQKILFQKGMQRHMSYTTTLKIVNQIEKRSQQMGKNGPTYYKENIIRTIQQLSTFMKQISEVEMEYVEKNILSVLDLEFHQSKFEEGSRMTQMHEEF